MTFQAYFWTHRPLMVELEDQAPIKSAVGQQCSVCTLTHESDCCLHYVRSIVVCKSFFDNLLGGGY